MEPVTREEMYLAAAAGEDVPVPEPVTRRDMYMKALIDKGGGSGGADWNAAEGEPGHVLNRTHYEEDAFEPIVLTDDVDYSAEPIDLSSYLGEGALFYKVNRQVMPPETYEGATLVHNVSNSVTAWFERGDIDVLPNTIGLFSVGLNNSYTDSDGNITDEYLFRGVFLVVYAENAFGVPIGLYFWDQRTTLWDIYNVTITKKIIHPLPYKYLPEFAKGIYQIDLLADEDFVEVYVDGSMFEWFLNGIEEPLAVSVIGQNTLASLARGFIKILVKIRDGDISDIVNATIPMSDSDGFYWMGSAVVYGAQTGLYYTLYVRIDVYNGKIYLRAKTLEIT